MAGRVPAHRLRATVQQREGGSTKFPVQFLRFPVAFLLVQIGISFFRVPRLVLL
jgi:hypothetical protein